MSKYIELLLKTDSYDKYKEELIDFKKATQYDKELFEKILNFNFDNFLFLLKIFFLPFAIVFILKSIGDILDIKLLSSVVSDSNSIISLIVEISIVLGILFMSKIIFTKRYIFIKYSLYTLLIPLIIADKIQPILGDILLFLVLIFNIFLFFKMKNIMFDFIKIPLPYNNAFACKYKNEISKIKCTQDYVDVSFTSGFDVTNTIRNLTIIFSLLFILALVLIVYMYVKDNSIHLVHLIFLFIIYYSIFNFYYLLEMINSVMTLKNIAKDCENS